MKEVRERWESRAVAALAVFFAAGAVVSLLSCVSLLSPGGPLEPMWRLNPRARAAFGRLGPLSPLLMATVSTACAITAAGLWHRRLWGHRLAVGMLVVNLLGDVTNVLLGTEPRALFGVPVVIVLLAFLGRPGTRSLFRAERPV